METNALRRAKLLVLCIVCIAAAPTAPAKAASNSLEIYFIDVEGGQSTLIVTPAHKALLIDTGYAGDGTGFKPGDPRHARDANRIVAAADDAKVHKIDYLLITHFHDDHDGGVRELSQLMPIGAFVDHGSPSPQVASNTGVEQLDAFDVYASVRSGLPHLQPQPGERLPLKDLQVTVVSSAGRTLTKALSQGGSRNDACQDRAPAARDPFENPRSTGVLIQYGKFRFLDVGDLTGQPLFDLACPNDMIGRVDVYLVAHHGGPDAADSATFAAFKPRVAVMNNGIKKGGALITYQALHKASSLEDVWQLHRSDDEGDSNFPDRYVANMDETTAHWIKLVAKEDGSFQVFNQRTNERKSYGSRRGGV
jgi:competence protein ComEC